MQVIVTIICKPKRFKSIASIANKKKLRHEFLRYRAANFVVDGSILQKLNTHPSSNACPPYLQVLKRSGEHFKKPWINLLPHNKYKGIRWTLKVANTAVSGQICPKFELIKEIIHILVTFIY